MRLLIVCLLLVSCTLVRSQDTIKNVAKSDTSSTYFISLTDNTILSGKIIDRTNNEIIFNDITIGKVTIPVSKIKKMIRITGDQNCILTTNDGKTITGLIVNQSQESITLKTESLGELTISNTKIRDIKLVEKEQLVNGKYYFPNPHPTRYLFGPTAIPMEKGEGYYQNAYVLANSVQVGVSENFSMGGGIVIPFMFFITPKFGYKVAEKIYLGGGILAATTISSDLPFGVAIGYGTITTGTKENNFTLSAGWGAVRQENTTYDPYTYYSTSTTKWEAAKRPMFSLSGMVRIAPKCALITENWFFATKDYVDQYPLYTEPDYQFKYHSVLTFGFRLMGEKNSFDLAIAVPSIDGSTMGLPYLDYVFKF